MKIALLHASFAIRGGAEQHVRDLRRALIDRGHSARIYSAPSAFAEPADRAIDARFTARAGARVPRLGKALLHLGDLFDPTGVGPDDLRDFGPDVVHVHNWQGLGVLAVARIARAYPTCHTVHDHAICDPNNALGNLGRSKPLDALLAMRSAWIGRRLARTTLIFPSERTRTTVLRCAPALRGAGHQVLAPAVPVPPGPPLSPPNGTVLLYLGALSPHKGVDLLLETWRSRRSGTGTLLVAGDGPLRAEVEALAAADPSVRYLGYLDAAGKRDALAMAGWLVFPSRLAETYGLVCAEALVAGRPILASRTAEPVMASPGSYLSFTDGTGLRDLLERAVSLPDHEYRALTASARCDGDRLGRAWSDHVDSLVRGYETMSRTRRPGAGSGALRHGTGAAVAPISPAQE